MAGLHIRCNASGTPNLISTVFCALTLAPAQTFALGTIPALSPLERYTNKDLQRASKLALKLFVKGQEYNQLQANFIPQKQLLKVWFPNLYYKNLYLNCYCFCQQYENYFKTARANRPNQVFFTALFLYKAIIQQ